MLIKGLRVVHSNNFVVGYFRFSFNLNFVNTVPLTTTFQLGKKESSHPHKRVVITPQLLSEIN